MCQNIGHSACGSDTSGFRHVELVPSQSIGEVPEKASPVRVLDSASADARKLRYLFCSQRSLKIRAHDPLSTANARIAHEFPKVCLFLQFLESPQSFNGDIQTNLIAILETVGYRLRS